MVKIKPSMSEVKNLSKRSETAFILKVTELEFYEGKYDLVFQYPTEIVAKRLSGVNKIHVPEDYQGELKIPIDVHLNPKTTQPSNPDINKVHLRISLRSGQEELDSCTVTCFL